MTGLKAVIHRVATSNKLTQLAKKYGMQLGASQVVAGTTANEALQLVEQINRRGLRCTVDHLGEFVEDREEAKQATLAILQLLDQMHARQVQAHLSLKLSQIGLDIDEAFCYHQAVQICERAQKYGIFITIDMEDAPRVTRSFRIIDELLPNYSAIGTVIQAYLFASEERMAAYPEMHFRLVKGAYREPADRAFTTKQAIDEQFLKLIKQRLDTGVFTSIATHDHRIIEQVQQYIQQQGIEKTAYEFQFLYGFRQDVVDQLHAAGEPVCLYIPYGEEWYGYLMRRLVERPQNSKFLLHAIWTPTTKILTATTAIGLFWWFNRRKK